MLQEKELCNSSRDYIPLDGDYNYDDKDIIIIIINVSNQKSSVPLKKLHNKETPITNGTRYVKIWKRLKENKLT